MQKAPVDQYFKKTDNARKIEVRTYKQVTKEKTETVNQHVRVLKSISIHRNENENQSEIPFYIHQNGEHLRG